MLEKLPSRRRGMNFYITHVDSAGNEQKYLLTANIDDNMQIKEVFCANPMTGSDMEAILTDGCILISLGLQGGIPLSDFANRLGEKRAEGQLSGPPSSPLGSIVRGLVKFSKDLKNETGG